MNIVFAHDHRFKEDSYGNIYSGNDFNDEVWKRYKFIGENITIIARCEKVTSNEELKGYTMLKEKNVKLVKMPNVNNLKELILNNKKIKADIKKTISESDGIIIRLSSTIGNMVCTEAKKQKKKYLVEVVGCPWDSLWNYGTITGKLMAPIYYYLTKVKVRDSKYVIYVTNSFLQNRYPNKNINIGCSDVSIIDVDEDILKLKINGYDSKSNFSIGLMGSLDVNYKGHDTAFKALKEVLKYNSNVSLRLIGPGDAGRWKKLCNELGITKNVYFDGLKKNGDEVCEWLDNIDIYIQPSLQEGLPRAVVEAQSRGCAVIVTDCGGMAELVDKNFIIQKKDSKSLANKILKLINDKELMKREAIRNFENSQNYKKDKLNEKRLAFYEDFKQYIRSN